MLDLGFVRDNLQLVEAKLRSRGMDPAVVLGEFRQLDAERRQAITRSETLKAERNRASKEIGALMGQKKLAEAEAKKTETKGIGEKIASIDQEVAEVEAARDQILLRIPNVPHASVPVGKSAEQKKKA